MKIRDRIKAFRRVPASELRPNPKNWRTHPPGQADALRGVLAEVGFAQAAVARELADGSLELIDGHLRAETAPDAEIPVLVLDVSEAEADKLLVSLDPLAGLAGTDAEKLDELLRDVQTGSEALANLFTQLAEKNGLVPAGEAGGEGAGEDAPLKSGYEVVVVCRDEAHQREVYEQLQDQGHECRVLTY